MKIENCEYSHYCGDKSSDNAEKQVWYCPRFGNKDWCPYGICKMVEPKPVEPVKQEPKKKEKPVVVYAPYAEETRGRKTKYDWDRALPIMQRMRDAGKFWPEIANATGIPRQSLITRWHQEGMTIRTGAGD